MLMKRRLNCRWQTVLLAAVMAAGAAHASVTIGGTRVVYPLDQREVTVKLTNDSRNPSLVQVWLDSGDSNAKIDDSKTPFVITPPIFRMNAGRSQTLRIIYSGDALPQDRESVFWLNVLDIPPKAVPKPDVNTLQLAYRTRIKLFARPPTLPDTPDDAPRQIEWKVVPADEGKGQALLLSNPTAYHVSFSKITVTANGHRYEYDAGGMVVPHGRETFAIPKMEGVQSGQIHYIAINDFGGAIEGDAVISP
ncbi:fimbria/pilus periplasmic chaperone [Paraburkholderia hospita]|uniref:Fimbrial chaperone protein n=1 Tax=Paraburkholderia hospita TaxID=169430 RepID=A0AAN1JET3_9BURK|nr:molecular chaperone EcpD [Paraburkholderia hospita]EIM97224.1 putative fimbrial chaperone protein [Paraburkholderia hospita]OUL91736.1 molecular chaperone EcpD [Paraburkholderia hospita]OUL95512.1 molecular chaperone EcpD [Paraburkholderia hospita]SEH51777.1 chaperone protein EcpD [Paraburkholderia hospita]